MGLLDYARKKKDQLVSVLNRPAPQWAQKIPKMEDALLPRLANAPQFNFSQKVQNPVGKFAAQVAEGTLNIPSKMVQNYGKTMQDIHTGKLYTPRGLTQFAGRTGENALDVVSMGKGKMALQAGEQFLKKAKPLGQLMKEGWKQGTKLGTRYGAGYGLATGVQDENATLPSVAKNTAVSTVAGRYLGGSLGGGLPALGALPGVVKNSVRNRLNKPQVTDSIPAHYVPTREKFPVGQVPAGYRQVGNQDAGYGNRESLTEKLIPPQVKTNRSVPTIRDWGREVRGAMPAPGMSIQDVSNKGIVQGSRVRSADRGNVGTVVHIDENGNALVSFRNKNNKTQASIRIPSEKLTVIGGGRFTPNITGNPSQLSLDRTPQVDVTGGKFFDIVDFAKSKGFKSFPGDSSDVEYAAREFLERKKITPDESAFRINNLSPRVNVIPDRPAPVSTLRQMAGKQALPENQKMPQTVAAEPNIKPPISNQPYKEVNPFEAYSAQGQKASPVGTKLRTVFQDRMASQKKLQQQPGVKVEEGANPYQAEELFHGRVGSRVEQATKEVETTFRGMADYAKKSGIDFKQLRGAVNRYLQSKHTAERNALHGDGASGLTNQQADEILSTIGSSEHGTAVAKFASELSNINTKTLDILQESGILSKAQVDTMRTAYKNHVPLQRIMDEGDDVLGALGGGKGYSVQSSGVKKAVGSEREVNDIAGNILANYEQAIIRAEKNRYGQNVLKFAQNNKETGLFEISTKGTPDNNTLSVFVNGEKVNVKIKNDQLAATLRGVDIERIPELLRPVAAVTRFFSSMATRYNPEFVLSNIVRDSQELAVYIASQADMPKGSVGAVTKMIPGSANDVRKALAGDFSSEGSKLYQQMVADGGTTGGLGLSTRKQVQLDISKLEKLVQSKPRQAAQYLAEGIDNWNQVFEDATRLSAYKQAIASGLSRERAASIAKNSTVNFNRKGTSGPVINSLYMFANASIQGSAKMLIAMKNPKVAAVTVAAVTAPVFAINKWNDDVDPEWRDKVSDWDRQSNLVVMVPSDEGAKYFTIPVSWGLKPIKVIADQSYDIATGNAASKSEIAGKIITAFTESYNPVGGTDLVSAAVPTVLDTPVDIARNQKWSGSMIRSDKELVSNHENYFGSLNNSPLGQAAIGATSKVADMTGNKIDINPANLTYALQQLIGGAGRSAERFLTTATAPFRDGELETKDVPFVNRFYKTVPDEQIEKNQKYKIRDLFEKELKKLKNGSEEQKAYIQEYLWNNPKENRGGIMYGLQLKGVMTKGLTTKDKDQYEKEIENKPINDAIKSSKSKLTSYAKLKDVESWMNEANQLYKGYDKLLKSGKLSESEALKVKADMKTLTVQYNKYKGYKGFTKPKTGSKAKQKKISVASQDDANFIVKSANAKMRPLRAFGRSRTNLASVSRPNIRRPKRLN